MEGRKYNNRPKYERRGREDERERGEERGYEGEDIEVGEEFAGLSKFQLKML